MKLLTNLSNQSKGILLIIGGTVLLLNSFGFIERLDVFIGIGGALMIIIGIMMARFHEKVYVLLKKEGNKQDDDRPGGF